MEVDVETLKGVLTSVEEYYARCKDAVAKRAK